MKIAICNETYRDWSFEDAFQHASACGYDGIEIAPFTIHSPEADLFPDRFPISDSRINQVASLAAENELEIVGLHWLLAKTRDLHLTSPDESTRQRTADYLGQLAGVCHKLGGDIMVLGSPQQRNMAEGMSIEQANEFAIDCLSRCLPVLKEHDVTIALEPLGPEEGNFMLTAAWARQLIEEMDSPFVKLHLDVKAMSTEEDSIPDIIEASGSNLVHFHANDPNRRGPGMGAVQYEPIIQALKSIDYQGWLSVEVFDESVPPETTAVESIGYLRTHLGDSS